MLGCGDVILRQSIGLLWCLSSCKSGLIYVVLGRIELLVELRLLLICVVLVRCGWFPSLLKHLVYELLLRVLVRVCGHIHLVLHLVVSKVSG